MKIDPSDYVYDSFRIHVSARALNISLLLEDVVTAILSFDAAVQNDADIAIISLREHLRSGSLAFCSYSIDIDNITTLVRGYDYVDDCYTVELRTANGRLLSEGFIDLLGANTRYLQLRRQVHNCNK